jgi:pyruvate-ferredoxin/flavodoxin oxidoreductase
VRAGLPARGHPRQGLRPEPLDGAPETFKSTDYKAKDFKGKYTIQVAPEDCTGCGLCVEVCPAKNKSNEVKRKAINMVRATPLREPERENYAFFLDLPEVDRTRSRSPTSRARSSCSRCSSTPAPAPAAARRPTSSCSPSSSATACPHRQRDGLLVDLRRQPAHHAVRQDADGRGPAWSNSLFEDNAEFGFGFPPGLDKQAELARELVKRTGRQNRRRPGRRLLTPTRPRGRHRRAARTGRRPEAKLGRKEKIWTRSICWRVADYLVKKSVWIVGGDGWAYDIGYGGLDHVWPAAATSTCWCSTPRSTPTPAARPPRPPRWRGGQVRRRGKPTGKKDLGLMAMSLRQRLRRQIALGAKDARRSRPSSRPKAYDGPSLIIAYSHCIAHGINMATG